MLFLKKQKPKELKSCSFRSGCMFFRWLPVIFILFFSTILSGQELPADYPPASFHQERREALRTLMPANSVAVFFANPVRNKANDVDYHYHQDPNFYYLTGLREPHAVLLIFKESQQSANGQSIDELLFVQPRDPAKEQWNGRRLGTAGAREQLGFDFVFTNQDFLSYTLDWDSFDQILFYEFFDDVRDTDVSGDLYDLKKYFREQVGYEVPGTIPALEPTANNLNILLLDTYMEKLRGEKLPLELDLLRKAISISCIGQIEVMKAMHPGMSETEVQGIHEFVFKKYGAEDEGYPSIVGAGHNGCILHYIENNKPEISSKELILMDVGAQYRGYTADVTRTIPVNGKFNKEQKIIYQLVYDAQAAAFDACKPGKSFAELNTIARDVIAKGLVQLGIIEAEYEVRKYYPHGLSHHLGLDVHDKGDKNALVENMVITIEPGIYIPKHAPCPPKWHEIAVRIEDDVVVTSTGCENLSSMAPSTIDEIEAVMAEPSVLDQFNLPELESISE